MSSTRAPGRLETLRSFVNTIEPEDELDLLQADGELPQWCEDTGLCPGVDEQGLARLREFREALRSVLETHAGEAEESAGWQVLEPYAAATRFTMSVADEGLRLRATGSGSDVAIGEMLSIAYDALSDGTWRRLKACRKASCRWAFYDRSKNGSGAWCSMRVCGNREKAKRRRSRQKSDG